MIEGRFFDGVLEDLGMIGSEAEAVKEHNSLKDHVAVSMFWGSL